MSLMSAEVNLLHWNVLRSMQYKALLQHIKSEKRFVKIICRIMQDAISTNRKTVECFCYQQLHKRLKASAEYHTKCRNVSFLLIVGQCQPQPICMHMCNSDYLRIGQQTMPSLYGTWHHPTQTIPRSSGHHTACDIQRSSLI